MHGGGVLITRELGESQIINAITSWSIVRIITRFRYHLPIPLAHILLAIDRLVRIIPYKGSALNN